MSLFVRPQAAADIEDAYSWYERQRPGLGGEFVDALTDVFAGLLEGIFIRSWMWSPPDCEAFGGTPTGIRWGRSLFMLPFFLFMALAVWMLPGRMARVARPNKGQEQTSAPSGAGG